MRSTTTSSPSTDLNSSSSLWQNPLHVRAASAIGQWCSTSSIVAVGVGHRFGQVALGRADLGQPGHPLGQRCSRRRQRPLVGLALDPGPGADHLVEAVVAEGVADRRQQLDGELGVAVGEQVVGEARQPPRQRRPAPAPLGADAIDSTRPVCSRASRC